jgi:hypothetical protein
MPKNQGLADVQVRIYGRFLRVKSYVALSKNL